MQLIFIDDDDFVRTSVASLFSSLYPVTEFGDPTIALTHLQELDGECVIVCDYDMPKLNGRDVYDRLDESLQKRFVLFTSNRTIEKPPLGRLIHKPAGFKELKAAIEGARDAE